MDANTGALNPRAQGARAERQSFMTLRRFAVMNVLFLISLLIVGWFGSLVPSSAPAADGRTFTLDRGGLLRFNNGKIAVQSAYAFNLDEGPLQLPSQIDRWEGVDFPLNLEALGALNPELLINRVYRNASRETVFLTIIGANTSRKLHRPQVCYNAADWTLTELSPQFVSLDSGQVELGRIHARYSALNEERIIFYWYLWRDDRRRIEDGAYEMQVAAPTTANQTLEQASVVAARFIRQILRQTVRSQASVRFPF